MKNKGNKKYKHSSKNHKNGKFIVDGNSPHKVDLEVA